MTKQEMPARIWMPFDHYGPWFIEPVQPSVEYRRADLPTTPAEAMRCPEVAAMSAVLHQIREALPHVEVMRDTDREIVNDMIWRADAALAPVAREG